MGSFLSLLQAIESVINFRVRLKDVHCENNEVIFSPSIATKQTMSVKREASEENRKFDFNWEERYFFTNSNGKPQCLLRLQIISIPKEMSFYLKSRCSTKHEKTSGKYLGNSREAILK